MNNLLLFLETLTKLLVDDPLGVYLRGYDEHVVYVFCIPYFFMDLDQAIESISNIGPSLKQN